MIVHAEAPAKINLYLAVGPRLPNGLHEIASIMQTVSLCDLLAVSAAERLSLSVQPPGAAPEDESNLTLRAAAVLASAAGVPAIAALLLIKVIPVAAGLAGGSADAAAALVAYNRLWAAGLSRKALERLAASIGSDVAFCVAGGTAAVGGTGERVSPLPCKGPLWWVLGISSDSLSSGAVYSRFSPAGPLAADTWAMENALARGDLDAVAAALRNDLEPAAFSLLPGLESGRAAMLEAGALGAVLSGSGPTWLGLARSSEHAESVAAALSGVFARVEVVHSVTHGARVVS